MSTALSTLQTRSTQPAARVSRRDASLRPRRAREASPTCSPTSLLDEARRRMKHNVLAIAGRLRLDPPGLERDETEVMLTEMETRLQSMAQLHRSLCRAGDFEQVDLAVFLRQAAQLRNSPPRSPLSGGWALEADGSLIWIENADADADGVGAGVTDLETALGSVPAAARDLARRAVFASAVLAPPWIFGWRAPQPGTSGIGHLARPGDAGVRLRATNEGISLELSISDRGPGLPDSFDSKLQRKLALELVSVLARLVNGSLDDATQSDAVFDVTFVPSYREVPGVELRIEGRRGDHPTA